MFSFFREFLGRAGRAGSGEWRQVCQAKNGEGLPGGGVLHVVP